MLRIRGSIGDWPVDLTLEMDDSDWARLGAHWVADADRRGQCGTSGETVESG
jgi:hypothetical protein